MKNLNVTGVGMKEMSREEAMMVVGGNSTVNSSQSISSTISGGGGGLRSFLLGFTIFGMASLCGMMTGNASL